MLLSLLGTSLLALGCWVLKGLSNIFLHKHETRAGLRTLSPGPGATATAPAWL